MSDANPESRWFGERPVTPDEKRGLVRGVFDTVANRYDLMNDLMSGGVHRIWKAQFVASVALRPGQRLLDVAGGTGDIAFACLNSADRRLRLQRRLARMDAADAEAEADADNDPNDAGDGVEDAGAPIHPATGAICDLTEAMVRVGRERAIARKRDRNLEFLVGNAEALPIADRSVDVYTIAFGLRNVVHIDAALAEARRVLKPGGRFLCLEFSRVVLPVLGRAYDAYSYAVIPRLGQWVANDRDSYQYLVESIRRFPEQSVLARRMEAAGLKRARWENLSAGIAAIHTGWRI